MSDQTLPTASSREVWAALRGLWRGQRRRFALILALYGAAAVAGLAPPKLFGALVDRIGAGATGETVALFCGAMIVSVVLQAVLLLAATRTALVLGEDVFRDVRDGFMANALRLPIGMIERGGTGELVTRTTQDVRALGGTVRDAIPQTVIAAVTVLLTVTAAALTSPLIAPVYLLAVPLLFVVMRWYVRRAPAVYHALGASFGPMFASVHETATGARTVEALSLQEARNASMGDAITGHWITAVAHPIASGDVAVVEPRLRDPGVRFAGVGRMARDRRTGLGRRRGDGDVVRLGAGRSDGGADRLHG